MRYTIRPISDRTAFTGHSKGSPFTATWADTLDLLDRELRELDATDVVFEVDVPDGAIRLDGMLYANAKVASPAVRIAFGSKHGPLTYATDAYRQQSYRRTSMASWQHNVRAIALGLEALRKVDRYGITRRGEQYAGWKALPAGTIALGQGLGKPQAAAILERFAIGGEPTQARQTIDKLAAGSHPDARRIYREARAMAHPDRNGGDRKAWDQVEQAARILGIAS